MKSKKEIINHNFKDHKFTKRDFEPIRKFYTSQEWEKKRKRILSKKL